MVALEAHQRRIKTRILLTILTTNLNIRTWNMLSILCQIAPNVDWQNHCFASDLFCIPYIMFGRHTFWTQRRFEGGAPRNFSTDGGVTTFRKKLPCTGRHVVCPSSEKFFLRRLRGLHGLGLNQSQFWIYRWKLMQISESNFWVCAQMTWKLLGHSGSYW